MVGLSILWMSQRNPDTKTLETDLKQTAMKKPSIKAKLNAPPSPHSLGDEEVSIATAVKKAVGSRSHEGGDLDGELPADEIDPKVLKQVQDAAREAAEEEIDQATSDAQVAAKESYNATRNIFLEAEGREPADTYQGGVNIRDMIYPPEGAPGHPVGYIRHRAAAGTTANRRMARVRGGGAEAAASAAARRHNAHRHLSKLAAVPLSGPPAPGADDVGSKAKGGDEPPPLAAPDAGMQKLRDAADRLLARIQASAATRSKGGAASTSAVNPAESSLPVLAAGTEEAGADARKALQEAARKLGAVPAVAAPVVAPASPSTAAGQVAP